MHRRNDRDTSVTAALALTSDRLRGARLVALGALVAAEATGLTDHELAAATGSIQTSAGKRRLDLERLGLVTITDRRRSSPSGSPCIVWQVTAAGFAAWTEAGEVGEVAT